jgi:hypothetical protein
MRIENEIINRFLTLIDGFLKNALLVKFLNYILIEN